MYSMDEQGENQATIAESLKSLGLTKYEALVYIALVRVAGATATEIHELSGVPRASVYPVLDRLIQKNLVSVSNTSPKRFNPVRPDEGVDSLMKSIESDAVCAREGLNRIYMECADLERGDQELIWSTYGEENIRIRLLVLISNATESIRVFFYWGGLRKQIIQVLEEKKNSVSIEVVTDHWEGEIPESMNVWIKKPPGGHDIGPAKSLDGGVFLVDGSKAMVIMGSEEEGTSALYSEAQGFVRFFTVYWNFFSSWARKKNQ
jgi:sugar-specific transcriptional regulator TrmB